MSSLLYQQCQKGTLALSVFASFLLLQLLWTRYSISPRLPSSLPRDQLSLQFDSTNDSIWEDFPKRIWTTAPLSLTRVKKDDSERVRTWMDLNPEHRYELLTDGGAETYVKDNFPDHSRIVDTYMGIGDFILRADLIRYLVLLRDGGVYNDLDVGCLKPIDLWIPAKFRDNTSVVLGVEVDNDFGENRTRQFELVNWTIMARRSQPFMRYLVESVIDNLEKAAAKHNATLTGFKPQRQEVIDVTGPMALTQAAFQYLSDATQTTVTWQNFTQMKRPQLMADILVLPINAFGAGHQVQWSGADEDGSALVHHHFAGSWKSSHSDGPTQEEKKAAEEKEKAEQDKKEDEKKRKEEEERQQKKEEEERRKNEEATQKKEGEKAPTGKVIENIASEKDMLVRAQRSTNTTIVSS
ncbi:MAG: hypothetical protein Q9170_008224 [Blastenia crenularia]